MKKFLLISLILFGILNVFGQKAIGINTATPSALLDVQSKSDNTDGILFPMINNFSTINPGADQNGMLVFNTNSQGFQGLYFWDSPENKWQYIFQRKMYDMNLFKTITEGIGFSPIGVSNTNTNVWFKATFNTIETPDTSTNIQGGDLIIGKTGKYSLFFSGGVTVDVDGTVQVTEVGIFLDNNTSPTFISLTPTPNAAIGSRSANHNISNIITLTKGQRVSVKTRRTTNCTVIMRPTSTYSLVASYLD